MKKRFARIFRPIAGGALCWLLIAACGFAPAQDAPATYTNPVARNLPDPHVIRHGDRYYAYGTNAPGEGYRVLISPDLVHWTDGGFVYKKTKDSWGREHFWAPCVIERGGKFYLFYSSFGPVAPGRSSHRISVAAADKPTGPFVDLKAPLLDIGKAVIDAHAFIDEDGKAYLYYALDHSENNRQSHLYVVPLSDDLTQVIGQPTFCTRPDADWEGNEWNEAPFVFRHGDKYVMMYSARGFFDPLYALGYATADSPLGPWTKSNRNPILKKTAEVSGPGHNSVVASPDGTELFCCYHVHRKLEGGHERDLAIDRMTVSTDSAGEVVIEINGPTKSPQPMPAGAGGK
jgi:beta-xylosidase